jgi:hypothetical protein
VICTVIAVHLRKRAKRITPPRAGGNHVRVNSSVGWYYRLAPGLQLVGEYQYAHRHQGGFDFNQGAPGLNGATRDAQYQGLTFATVLTWYGAYIG